MEYKDFYTYKVYEDGRVYSTKRNKYLKGEITKHGYLQYKLSINGEQTAYKAHRLVAYLFLKTPNNYKELHINHKNGNKLNNHYSNLEWCTAAYNNYHARATGLNNISESNSKRWDDPKFRKKTSEHFSKVRNELRDTKWKKNGRFRYDIYDKFGNNYNREDLSKLLGLSQSYTDVLIREFCQGITNNYFEKHGIYIKDLKDTKKKVNRLSNATNNEKYVA